MAVDGGSRAESDGLLHARRQVLERRELLHTAIVDVDSALRRPGDGDVRWCLAVRGALTRMHTILQAHVRESEAPDGLLERVLEEDPGFGPRVAALRREHRELLARSADLVERCCGPLPAVELRREAAGLLEQVSAHRRRAGELLVDVYSIDLAAAD